MHIINVKRNELYSPAHFTGSAFCVVVQHLHYT